MSLEKQIPFYSRLRTRTLRDFLDESWDDGMSKTLDESVGDLMTAFAGTARRGQRPASFSIGLVKTGSEERLEVQCGGTLLTAADIWINEALLTGYSPKLIAETPLPGTCPDGTTHTPVTADQLTRGEFALKAGDRVVLLTEDQQFYYLICKVVKLA